jgi:hypothetical protein
LADGLDCLAETRTAYSEASMMGGTSIRPSGSFVAQDRQGRQYEVLVFHQDREIGSHEGRNRSKWLGRLKTAKGHDVNRLGPGRYEIAVDGAPSIPITSDDPNAP